MHPTVCIILLQFPRAAARGQINVELSHYQDLQMTGYKEKVIQNKT